jgi:alkanesulfonate monooxygenase SsuD/methylene tetrahydromethanopterin reductase-like flavin-dependent oxidoreductase (luciferase family)
MARIGVAISGGLSASDMVECVKLAEDLGYESAWVAEGHGGDQFAVLAACAQVTSRILLGTSISSVFVRTAPTIAMAAATVDDLSQHRFILGLGSSHRVQVGPEHGVTYAKPITRLREYVAIIRQLLRDDVVSYQGETVAIERFELWFTPRRREIPIYLAAVFPKMMQVCGELAQGVILTRSTLETGRQVAEQVAIGARRAGRQPEDIEITSLLPCSVDTDRQAAFDVMRPGVALYAGFFPRYNRLMAESGFAEAAERIRALWTGGDHDAAIQAVPDELIDVTGVVGTPDACRKRLEAYRQSGIAVPIISPFSRGPEGKARAMAAIRACAP